MFSVISETEYDVNFDDFDSDDYEAYYEEFNELDSNDDWPPMGSSSP